jgi:glucose/arabinose dehydrogenase
MRVSYLQHLSLFAAVALMSAMAAMPGSAYAQTGLRAEVVASGLQRPVGFVQDPSNSTIQFILQHGGRILVMKSGSVQPEAFLDLSSEIVNRGEMGLLGLAFPPDHATSGRFYVSFSSADRGEGEGHTVVARFQRASPYAAMPESRFDLRWSSGERLIRQPFDLHKAGHLAFGPDGYLYVATGDGGADANDAGDPLNNAQNLGSLLGKMLRIDVAVLDEDPDGFRVPPENPFAGVPGAAPEIWSIGFRNPWQFSFDAASGAMVIGDVGHDHSEEIDYEPAGRGGRNYGWRIREGDQDYDPSLPPAFFPIQEPLLALDRSWSRSITGGFVYRGHALGAPFAGRYFFADFVLRRLYSIALTIDPSSGEAAASDLRDHTDDLGGTTAVGGISAFGVDAAGELYIVSLIPGRILRLGPGAPVVAVESVTPTGSGLEIRGWSIDRRASAGSGIDAVHVYAYPTGSAGASYFLGAQGPAFEARSDVAAVYGASFEQSGFRILSDRWLPPGPTLFVVYAHSAITGQFEALGSLFVPDLLLSELVGWLDQYPTGTVTQPVVISGWAIDRLADDAPPEYGTGVAPVVVTVHTPDGSLVQSIPATTGFTRPDIGAIFGSRFQQAGFAATVYDLRPDRYFTRVWYWMSAPNRWEVREHGAFEIVPGPMVAIDTPPPGATVAPTFHIGGWAADLRSTGTAGVDEIHVWAYPNPGTGTPPIFLGTAAYGSSRPDVAAAFGPQFVDSGYNIVVGPLAPGTYDVVVFMRSTVTGTFPMNRVVRVTVN